MCTPCYFYPLGGDSCFMIIWFSLGTLLNSYKAKNNQEGLIALPDIHYEAIIQPHHGLL